MNLNLLELIGKWMTFAAISVTTFINVSSKSINTVVINDVSSKNEAFTSEVVNYQTEYVYTATLPVGTENILTKGVNGLSYIKNGEVTLINSPTNEVVEVGTGKIGVYSGTVTGYGPDCYGCSSLGNVSCKTRDRKIFSLISDGIYYTDERFGKVRVIAADHREFPCGTVIEITNATFNKEYGIVMDTGSAMRNAYDNGEILIDIAFEHEADAKYSTNRNTSFVVKRWGW